jgi:hypothetical protein
MSCDQRTRVSKIPVPSKSAPTCRYRSAEIADEETHTIAPTTTVQVRILSHRSRRPTAFSSLQRPAAAS